MPVDSEDPSVNLAIQKLIRSGAVPLQPAKPSAPAEMTPINIRVMGDKKNEVLVIQFSEPIVHVAFPPEEALKIGQSIVDISNQLLKERLKKRNLRRRGKKNADVDNNSAPV